MEKELLRRQRGEECGCQCRTCKRHGFDPGVEKILGGGKTACSRTRAWRVPRTERPGAAARGAAESGRTGPLSARCARTGGGNQGGRGSAAERGAGTLLSAALRCPGPDGPLWF